MQADTYLGITKTFKSEYKASGSRFYGFIFPVHNPDEFEHKIKTYKEEFADSTHVCSGCVIGLDKDYQRFSDDGEPSNSSGRPILNTILSKGIVNVGCAVVRYYGGKKLGIPGLIEAYGGAAQLCIDNAIIEELVVTDSIRCSIPEATAYLLFNFLSKRKYIDYVFTEDHFVITCAKSMTTELEIELEKIPNLAFI